MHCDDDDLAVIALGEPATAEIDAHLQQCARCRSNLDQWMAVAASARTVTPDDHPVAPPPSVWEAIRDEITPVATVTSLDGARRSRRPVGWLLAAAAGIGIVLGSVATFGLIGSPSEPTPAIMAQGGLDPLGEVTVTGTAALEDADGEIHLHVSVPDLPAVEDGYYEVWMATADASTMVAVGTLGPDGDSILTLPTGMEVADFPLVDVSVEHFDGDPGHSSDSVVRGLLAT